MTPKTCGPKIKNGGNMAMEKKLENLYFFETDELRSTYFDTFGEYSNKATRHPNFVGQSLKTAEIWR